MTAVLLLFAAAIFSPAEISRIQQTVRATPWAAEVAQRLTREADAWPESHVREFGLKEWALPKEGAGWSHAYVCPEHGMRLQQRAGRNLCPVDGKDYHGWPIDNVVYMQRNSANSNAARDLALAWRLTGKAEYADRARRIINAYTPLYPTLPIHDNNNRLNTKSGARIMSQTLSESHWIIPLVLAYDLVRETMPQSERDAFERDVLRNAAAVIARNDMKQSNWQSWHNAALLAIGLELDDDSLVKLAIGGPSGFKFQLQSSIMPDGPWLEGAWGYHFYAYEPLALTREMARRAGIPVPETQALDRMLEAPLKCVFPDGTLPNFNDSGLYKLSGARYYDPHTFETLLWGGQTNQYRPSTESELLPDSGIAVLRATGSDHTIAVKFGPHGGGHGHYDKLNFISFANGEHHAADPGTQAYAAKTHSTWDKETIAHNTVVIDEKSQSPATGKLLEWSVKPDRTVIRISAGNAYPGVELERTITHTAKYTTDVFSVRSTDNQPHKIDWIYHNYGALTTPLPFNDHPALPQTAGYQHLANAHAMTTAESWKVVFARDGGRTRVHMEGAPGTTVVIGDGLGPDLRVRVPFVMARRVSTKAMFVVRYDH